MQMLRCSTLVLSPNSDLVSNEIAALSSNNFATNFLINSTIASSVWLSRLIDDAHDGTEFSDSVKLIELLI